MSKRQYKFNFVDISKLFNSRNIQLFIFFLSVLVTLFFVNQSGYLRGLAYETIPDTTIADEYDYVWQAISLRKYGLPVGWSVFNGIYSDSKYKGQSGNLEGLGMKVGGRIVDIEEYKKNSKPITAVTEINWSKGQEYMTFVAPFFDHPPLGGLIYSLGTSKTISSFDQAKPADFRKPALIMAIITAVLLYIFIFQITSKPFIAALATAIYSTVPTYIFATRGAYLENVTPPFILSHLILLLLSIYLLKRKRLNWAYITLFLSGIVGGLAGLSKEPAVGFLIASVILVVCSRIRFKHILVLILGISLPILAYLSWGIWLQKDLFFGVILGNLGRSDFGSLKLLTTLMSLRFKGFPLDGWWIWGIISAFIVGKMSDLSKNKYHFLVLPLFINILVVLFTANSNYPWYFLSAIPFLAGTSAILIAELIENPNFVLLVVFFLIPFASSFYWGYSVFHQNSSQNLNFFRSSFVILIIAYLIRKYLYRYNYIKYIWFVVFIILLAEISKWNFQSIQYFVAHWDNLPVPSLPTI